MISQIAAAAPEQSSATEQINRNMEQIAGLVKESAGGSREAAKACEDLSNLALDLQKLVARFRVDDDFEICRNDQEGVLESPSGASRVSAFSATAR
jgi:hypothetical protein